MTTKRIDDKNIAKLSFVGTWFQNTAQFGETHGGTSKSSNTAGDFFEYTHPHCTNLKWFSGKKDDRGHADVFVDGVWREMIDTYSAELTPSSAVFDSGPLPEGPHTIKVVVKQAQSPLASNGWVECDMIEVTCDEPAAPAPFRHPSPSPMPGGSIVRINKATTSFSCHWSASVDLDGYNSYDSLNSNTPGGFCSFIFQGSTARCFGTRGPDQGFAKIFVNGVLQREVDTYHPTPDSNVLLLEATGLDAEGSHVLRIVVDRRRNPAATDGYIRVESFEASNYYLNYIAETTAARDAEYREIELGTKPWLDPREWRPVAYSAHAPDSGVTLHPGPVQIAFQRAIDYLNLCFGLDHYCHEDSNLKWAQWLPGSNEGRMLSGAANVLRWGEREDMREIVNTIVARIKARQRNDGYNNYYPENDSYALNDGRNSERKNYDRVFWTRGLLDAGVAGHGEAYPIVRRFYDWFNDSPYLGKMLNGNNATNGHPGGGLVYFSPVGTEKDLVATERYFDEDYWMAELKKGEPLSFTFYPGERPHTYDLLNIEAFLDEYRATGAAKYLEASLAAWKIYRENFMHVGGAPAICETHVYPPKSYYLTTFCTGETCGGVFWIQINNRLQQLFPNEERYAAEIEKSIYNVLLASQDSRGYVRYHNRLHGKKESAGCKNTCCEVSSTGLFGKLPEYIYSTAADGLYVNLFVASVITWDQDGQKVTLTQETTFPYGTAVSLTINTAESVAMNLRVRVPSWATKPLDIQANGQVIATGKPGKYLSLDRTWMDRDVIRFELPIGFSTEKYEGLDQVASGLERHALLYGPVLLALTGPLGRTDGVPHLSTNPSALAELLQPIPDKSLHFSIAGNPDHAYRPYWDIQEEEFTCFPIVSSGFRSENPA